MAHDNLDISSVADSFKTAEEITDKLDVSTSTTTTARKRMNEFISELEDIKRSKIDIQHDIARKRIQLTTTENKVLTEEQKIKQLMSKLNADQQIVDNIKLEISKLEEELNSS